jgi:hypothetical protein
MLQLPLSIARNSLDALKLLALSILIVFSILSDVRSQTASAPKSRDITGVDFEMVPNARGHDISGINFEMVPNTRGRDIVNVNFEAVPDKRSRDISGIDFVAVPDPKSGKVPESKARPQ